jgi:hypothetical protein
MKHVFLGRSIGTATDGRLVAASPLFKQRSAVPYRVVILFRPAEGNGSGKPEFCVTSELFETVHTSALSKATEPASVPTALHNGSYIQMKSLEEPHEALEKAMTLFCERIMKEVKLEYVLSAEPVFTGQ